VEAKLKHLEFIQGVINRLATNSFQLKGWSVLLVSALFALSAANAKVAFVFLAYIPAAVFWGLDGYFLMVERAYRDLYNRVRVMTDVDFSMATGDTETGFWRWVDATLSKTLWPFHGAIIGAILAVMFLQL